MIPRITYVPILVFANGYNEYAAQKMFFQSQAFPTEKSRKMPDFVWLFLFPKKAKRVQKKPEYQNLASKKTKWHTWL